MAIIAGIFFRLHGHIHLLSAGQSEQFLGLRLLELHGQ